MSAPRLLVALVGLSLVACTTGPEATFRVGEFGAIGDGETLATTAIQQAIDSCAATGGGRVVVPTGTYLTGSLRLRNGVMLQLTVGATLLASTDLDQFPSGRLIIADGVSRVGIEGRGTIDGQGAAFGEGGDQPSPRPDPLIEFTGCRDVTVRDVRIQSSPADTISFTRCDLVTVEGIHIANPTSGPDAGGLDVDGSRNVLVRDSLITAGHDAIRLKTSAADMLVENVVVSGCVLASDDAAIALGPSSAGVIRHSIFSDTIVRDSRLGIALFMRDGGTFEGIRFDDLTIQTGSRPDRPGYEVPVFMDIDRRASDAALGRIRGVFLSDIDVTTSGSILIAGQPERPIEDLALDRITLTIREPADSSRETKPSGPRTPGGPSTNDYADVAAHLAIGHVRGLRIGDLRATVDPPDVGAARRLLWGRDLVDPVLAGVSGRQSGDPAELPAIELIDCRRVMLRDSVAAPGTETFLRLVGEGTANVHLIGNSLGQATRAVMLEGVDRGAVTVDGRPFSGR